MEYLIEASQKLPIIGEYDVLVLGGGPAGLSAAVSAARSGAKVAIVERYGYLGGQATGGLVILLVGLTDDKDRIIKGICEETINRLSIMSSTRSVGPHVLFDPETMKFLFDTMIEENNITSYYHTFVSNVVITEGYISGIIVESKSGRGIIKAKSYIDATGDGDIGKYCNIPFQQESKNNLMPVTLGFRVGGINTEKVNRYTTENRDEYLKLIEDIGISTNIGGWIETLHPQEAWFNIAHIEHIDGTNSQDLTRAEITGRKLIFSLVNKFKKHIPGFENGYLIDTASQIGVRESRRIKGLYQFTHNDVNTNFNDSIARAPDYTGSGRGYVEIPYRCLIPKKVENLIFSGRCISVAHSLINMFREIPCCMATGEAAGVAAAIASKNNDYPGNLHKINVQELQDLLVKNNALI